MVKINITIENLEITNEQLLSLLGEDAKVTVAPASGPKKSSRPTCPDCGKTFKSQSSVNSHLKHCRKPAAKPVEAKPKKAKKAKPAKVCTQCGVKNTSAWRRVKADDGPYCNKCHLRALKPKKPKKPSYPGLTEKEILEAVISVVLSRTNEITTAHLIAGELVKIVDAKYEADDSSKDFKATILGRVSEAIKRIGATLGLTQCMVVDVDINGNTGAQIAMFPSKNYSVKQLTKLVSK